MRKRFLFGGSGTVPGIDNRLFLTKTLHKVRRTGVFICRTARLEPTTTPTVLAILTCVLYGGDLSAHYMHIYAVMGKS